MADFSQFAVNTPAQSLVVPSAGNTVGRLYPSSSFSAAQNWNTGASLASAGITLGSTLYGIYMNRKIAKQQARLAQAQARIEANSYAAEAVNYEQSAQRLAQAFGEEEYLRVRQQKSYLEDMAMDAALRGGAMEGSNAYAIQEQGREFDMQNAMAERANAQEQANYISAANQAMDNARNAILSGNAEAKSIRATERSSRITSLMNMSSSLLNTATSWYDRKTSIEDSQASLAWRSGVNARLNELAKIQATNRFNLATANIQ